MFFSDLELESASNCVGLVTDVADTFMSLGHLHLALKYYYLLESNRGVENVRKTVIFCVFCTANGASHRSTKIYFMLRISFSWTEILEFELCFSSLEYDGAVSWI